MPLRYVLCAPLLSVNKFNCSDLNYLIQLYFLFPFTTCRFLCLIHITYSCLITVPASNSSTVSTIMTSTLNPAGVGYRTRPADVAVAKGKSGVFGCGVAAASPNFTFTFYGSQQTYNLTCPYGYVEAIPQVSCSPPASSLTLHAFLYPHVLHHLPGVNPL